MVIVPEEFVRGRKLLVDTSFLTPNTSNESFTRRLYRGLAGLEQISLEEITENTNWVGNFAGFLRISNYTTVPEVITEVGDYIRILNEQTEFIGNKLGRVTRDALATEESLKISALWAYSSQLHVLKNMFGRRAIILEGCKSYNDNLQLAKKLDAEKIARERACAQHGFRRMYNTLNLETDYKIVAAAHYLADKNPVSILTRDKNIQPVSLKLSGKLSPAPKHRISVYNPDVHVEQEASLAV